MSYHRYIVPPPLILAVHPAPPPKPEPEVKKDKDGKPIVEPKKDKDGKPIPPPKDGEKAKPAVDKEVAKDKDDKDAPVSPASNAAEPPTPAPGQEPKEDDKAEKAAKGKKAGPAKGKAEADEAAEKPKEAPDAKDQPEEKDGKDEKDKAVSDEKDKDKDEKDKGKDEKEKEPEVPPPPLNLAGPAPARPLRARLDLDPSQPYPPVLVDPRGAYHKYAKAVQGEVMYLDVTKDGWLAEQWKEKPEREAMAELTGVAERERQREMAQVVEAEIAGTRKVPDTAEEILKELWNDLAKAPSNEMPVGDFWAKYDWSSAEAQVHLAPAPKRPKPVEEEPHKDAKDAEVKKDDKSADSGTKDKAKDTPAAEPAPKEDNKDVQVAEGASAKHEAEKKDEKKDEPVVVPPWTREGVEEVLATVGIQCNYNREKSSSRNYYEASGSYLLLAHNYFLLRREDWLQWKPEINADKFEVLVTSAHDRVFGEMVRAQQAEERKKKEEEYKRRKMKEYKEKKEREAKEKAEGKGDDKKGDDKGKGDDHKKDDDKAKEKADKGKDADEDKPVEKKVGETRAESPDTDISNAKVRDGEPVKPAKDSEEPVAGVMKNGKAMVAVPAKEQGKAANLDEKHEQEPEIVAPAKDPEDPKKAKDDKAPKEAKEGKEGKEDKEVKDKGKDDDKGDKAKEKDGKKPPAIPLPPALRGGGPPDPERDAALLAKMLADPASAKLGMDELKAAFQALELAAKAGMVPMPPMPGMPLGSGSDMPPIPHSAKKDPNQPLIWVWHERCEKWRWTNYVAGVHDVGPGGWEERDWRMFADDRGCEEYEDEEIEAEIEEVDLHDWSC